MQQYKLYTITPELNYLQRKLLKYDKDALLELEALAAGSSGLHQAEIATLNEDLCAHLPKDNFFDLAQTMRLSFATGEGADYTLTEGMRPNKLSFINYHTGEGVDDVHISAGIELELSRFSDEDNISASSYMFVEADAKTTYIPYKKIGTKLAEIFGGNNYYVAHTAKGLVIKNDIVGVNKVFAKDHAVLFQLGMAGTLAPTLLRQNLLEEYLLQDDNDKSILVDFGNKTISLSLKKDLSGNWQACIPEVSAIKSLKVIAPALDENGIELVLHNILPGSKYKVTNLSGLEVYAIRSREFKEGFDLDSFKECAKQRCELLPVWKELITSDLKKYQGVLDYYVEKLNQGMLVNPLSLVSFMQQQDMDVKYNDSSLPLMLTALADKPDTILQQQNSNKNIELEKKLFKEHDSKLLTFARTLAKFNETVKKRRSLTIEYEPYTTKVASPAKVITKAAANHIEYKKQKSASIELQAVARSWLAKLSYKKTLDSIVMIQAEIRRYLADRNAKMRKSSIPVIQSFMRMVLVQDMYAKPKKNMPKSSLGKKFVTKQMRYHISKDEATAFMILNKHLKQWYDDCFASAIDSVKSGNHQNIAAAFSKFNTNVEKIHKELEALLKIESAARMIAGKEKIKSASGKMEELLSRLCITKNKLYSNYAENIVTDELGSSRSLVEGIEKMYSEYTSGTQEVGKILLTDAISSMEFAFGAAKQEIDDTTLITIRNSIHDASITMSEYICSLPQNMESVTSYSDSIKSSLATLKESLNDVYDKYYALLESGASKKQAISIFNKGMAAHSRDLKEKLAAVSVHEQNALQTVRVSQNEKDRNQMMSGKDLPASSIFVVAANAIGDEVRSYSKTSRHKKHMAVLYRNAFKSARLDASIRIEAGVRMFLEQKRYRRALELIRKVQYQARILISPPALIIQQAGTGPAKTMIGFGSNYEQKFSISKLFYSGIQKIKNTFSKKETLSREEAKERGLAAISAQAVMSGDDVSPKNDSPKKEYTMKELTKDEKDALRDKDQIHLQEALQDRSSKVDADITLLEMMVTVNPKDKHAIAKLRYLYAKHGFIKSSLVDEAILQKAKLACMKRSILDKDADTSGISTLTIARSLAAHIDSIPIKPIMLEKSSGRISYDGGYAWPKILNKIANKKSGLMHSANSSQEREIWFETICKILKQSNSLTPTIDVGGEKKKMFDTTISKREETGFIDNAVTQIVSAMSSGIITDTNLLLLGLTTAIYQVNHGGYKQRVLSNNKGQERDNMINLLKSFNIVLDHFEAEVLLEDSKSPNIKHSDEFIAKKESLESAFVELIDLFKEFNKISKHSSIGYEWLGIVGKIHFLAYDNSFVQSNNIGFAREFLNHHKACICEQKGPAHPVRNLLLKSRATRVFYLGTEQLPLSAQEMLELGEVTLNNNKSSSDIELVTTGGNKAAVVVRPYNKILIQALLFICAVALVVTIGLLPTVLANYLNLAIPAITLLIAAVYSLVSMVDTEVNTGSFQVANPHLLENSEPVTAADLTRSFRSGSFAAPSQQEDDNEEVEVDLFKGSSFK